MADEDSKVDDNGEFLPDLCGPQQVLALILISEMLVGSLMMVAYGIDRFDWTRFGMVSMLTQWIVLVSTAILCKLRPRLSRLHAVVAGLASYLLTLLCTLVFSTVMHYVNYGSFLKLSHTLLANLLLAAVFSGIGLRYLYLQQQLRIQQKAEMQSRIQALQSRIRPHFLFNSMNTIASLISVDPEKAELVVVELSQLFRASLREASLVPLKDEIDLCRYYVDIEQMRLGERMQVEWRFEDVDGRELSLDDERFLARKIPSFLLQPLLENAIYHGIQPLPEGGTIVIWICLAPRQVEIEIRNPMEDSDDSTLALDGRGGNGIALENIRHRLSAYYEGAASLKVVSAGKEFLVKLRYPCKE